LNFVAVEQRLFERGGFKVNGLRADEDGLRCTQSFGGRCPDGIALRILSGTACAKTGERAGEETGDDECA
jgi:hypothetical protein